LIVNECLELVKQHVGQQRWKSAFDTPAQNKAAPSGLS